MSLRKGYAVSSVLERVPLFLVSSGPFCREVLAAAGLGVEPVSPPIAEPAAIAHQVAPSQEAEALAYFRARLAAEKTDAECVLAVETLVAVGGKVFGRPPGRLEAAEMLRSLSGTRHAVITGVALLMPGVRLIASEVTYVTMAPMSEADIMKYLASGQWLGIPGAYATPEMAERFITKLEGSFSNVMGLPVELVDRMISEAREHPESHRFAQLQGLGR
jgi:septum formation protein